MKDRALYHLMQATAAKLAETQNLARFRALADSLVVSHDKMIYALSWKGEEKTHQLELPDAAFTFFHYMPTEKDFRQENWNVAFDTWEKIAALSGLPIDTSHARAAMGFEPSAPSMQRFPGWSDFAVAIITTTIVASLEGLTAALYALVAIISLLVLAEGFISERRIDGVMGRIATGLGVALASHSLDSLIGVATLTVPLATLCLVERNRSENTVLWMASGSVAGLVCLFPPPLSVHAPVLIFSLAAIAIMSLMTKRLPKQSAESWLGGLAIVLVFALVMRSSYTSTTPLWHAGLILDACASILLLAIASTWWFFGSLPRLMPWISMIALSIAALNSIIQDSSAGAGLAGYATYALLALKRRAGGTV